jgi:hypothetical protein
MDQLIVSIVGHFGCTHGPDRRFPCDRWCRDTLIFKSSPDLRALDCFVVTIAGIAGTQEVMAIEFVLGLSAVVELDLYLGGVMAGGPAEGVALHRVHLVLLVVLLLDPWRQQQVISGAGAFFGGVLDCQSLQRSAVKLYFIFLGLYLLFLHSHQSIEGLHLLHDTGDLDPHTRVLTTQLKHLLVLGCQLLTLLGQLLFLACNPFPELSDL